MFITGRATTTVVDFLIFLPCHVPTMKNSSHMLLHDTLISLFNNTLMISKQLRHHSIARQYSFVRDFNVVSCTQIHCSLKSRTDSGFKCCDLLRADPTIQPDLD